MTARLRAVLMMSCALTAGGLLAAGPALAASTPDAPTAVCYTFLPSETPSGVSTATAEPPDSGVPTGTSVPGDTGAAGSGGASDTAVASDSGVPTDTGGPTDSGVPTDTTVATDTGVPTDGLSTGIPTGPITACALPGVAEGGSGQTDPLAHSGSDTALLALLAAALLATGVALSIATARLGRSRRTH